MNSIQFLQNISELLKKDSRNVETILTLMSSIVEVAKDTNTDLYMPINNYPVELRNIYHSFLVSTILSGDLCKNCQENGVVTPDGSINSRIVIVVDELSSVDIRSQLPLTGTVTLKSSRCLACINFERCYIGMRLANDAPSCEYSYGEGHQKSRLNSKRCGLPGDWFEELLTVSKGNPIIRQSWYNYIDKMNSVYGTDIKPSPSTLYITSKKKCEKGGGCEKFLELELSLLNPIETIEINKDNKEEAILLIRKSLNELEV